MKRSLILGMLGVLLLAMALPPVEAANTPKTGCTTYTWQDGDHRYQEMHCCSASRCDWWYRDCTFSWWTGEWTCDGWQYGGSYRNGNNVRYNGSWDFEEKAYASTGDLPIPKDLAVPVPV